jgi:hypothetical protein
MKEQEQVKEQEQMKEQEQEQDQEQEQEAASRGGGELLARDRCKESRARPRGALHGARLGAGGEALRREALGGSAARGSPARTAPARPVRRRRTMPGGGQGGRGSLDRGQRGMSRTALD